MIAQQHGPDRLEDPDRRVEGDGNAQSRQHRALAKEAGTDDVRRGLQLPVQLEADGRQQHGGEDGGQEHERRPNAEGLCSGSGYQRSRNESGQLERGLRAEVASDLIGVVKDDQPP